MSVTIDCPEPAAVSHSVAVVGSSTAGVICAHGTALPDAVPGPPAGGTTAPGPTVVFAKVYQSFDPTGAGAGTPAGDAVSTTADDDGNWKHEAIPGGVCSSADPFQPNILVVWVRFPNGTSAGPFTRNFPGLCANTVDCCDGSRPGPAAVRAAAAGVPLTMAPRVWSVLAAGFGAAWAGLNGTWRLEHRHTAGGFCVWDNGGDGGHLPRVELRCESPFAVTWSLTLSHRASGSWRYARTADGWAPVGANVLRREGNGSFADAAPEQLTVVPG